MKSEKWGDMFVDLLPGNEVETQSIVKVHLEEPPEPMVKRGNCFFIYQMERTKLKLN